MDTQTDHRFDDIFSHLIGANFLLSERVCVSFFRDKPNILSFFSKLKRSSSERFGSVFATPSCLSSCELCELHIRKSEKIIHISLDKSLSSSSLCLIFDRHTCSEIRESARNIRPVIDIATFIWFIELFHILVQPREWTSHRGKCSRYEVSYFSRFVKRFPSIIISVGNEREEWNGVEVCKCRSK